MIKEGQVHRALDFAREELADFKYDYINVRYVDEHNIIKDAKIQVCEVTALLAYSDPEASPVAYLVS